MCSGGHGLSSTTLAPASGRPQLKRDPLDSGKPYSMPTQTLTLDWHKFHKMTEARAAFPRHACIYVQADSQGRAKRIGKASKGLEARYRGGTGYALDAAMDGSANLVFVAPVPASVCAAVEEELIWRHREVFVYNNVGRIQAPSRRLRTSARRRRASV